MKRFATLLPIGVLAVGCSMFPGGGGADPGAAPGVAPPAPANPVAEMRPDLLVIEPALANPGDVVALTFPEETTRGILFVLDQRVDDGWVTRFYLVSDGPGQGWQREWWPVDAEGFAIPDIGVGGAGPDRVLIPDIAGPGEYRICTGNAGADFCAPIEIAAP